MVERNAINAQRSDWQHAKRQHQHTEEESNVTSTKEKPEYAYKTKLIEFTIRRGSGPHEVRAEQSVALDGGEMCIRKEIVTPGEPRAAAP
jgi:hypothetical protein